MPHPRTDLAVHSPKEFQAVIRYERARADRASSRFSLLALPPGAGDRGLSELVQALRGRLRATDVLGWLDERTLSILLPGADLTGTSRIKYAPNVRLVRVMCSGRVEPSFILQALIDGCDGVWVGG